jgi:hypothetical protein
MQTIHASSIGNVAFNVRTTVNSVERIASRLHLEPVMVIDGVKHFDDQQVEKIRSAIAKGIK